MAHSSPSSGHHDHEHGGEHHHHDHEPHNWGSPDYVANWAKGQDHKEANRQHAFSLIPDTIPYNKQQPVAILDLGSGYGALSKFLLERFPGATAVCQDGSEEMAKLGRERRKDLIGRFGYVICDFSRHGWNKLVGGPFDAIVSSIAIHNVGSPNVIRGIYEDAHTLAQPGGCFLNFDRHEPPIEDQMKWLRGAGFKDVQCFWQDENRALFGGFKKE